MIVPMAASLLSLWLAKGSYRLLDCRCLGKEFIYYSYPVSWAIGIIIVLVSHLHGGWKENHCHSFHNRITAADSMECCPLIFIYLLRKERSPLLQPADRKGRIPLWRIVL